jgi:DNA-binding IclR family transcriptional regulator
MSRNKHTVQVLTILSENLANPQPQLVPTTTIAGRLELGVNQLRPLLRTMEGMGVIQSDPDLRYHLITAEGVRWLRERQSCRIGS